MQCRRCVLTSQDDRYLSIDGEGVCNHCREFDISFNPVSENERKAELNKVLTEISAFNSKAEYNCITGVSGGIDSTYLIVKALEVGLKPLLVHFDNGWNTSESVNNLNNLIDKYKLDLITYVVDWDEFKDIQTAMLKASVIDIELPTDHGFIAVLFKEALRRKIPYIITGHNSASESILPKSWHHCKMDYLNVISIHKKFGKRKLKTLPYIDFFKMYNIEKKKKLKSFNLLDYINYDRNKAIEELREHMGWQDYGGKHEESLFTRFYQGYILPVKFGVDKRKAHVSSAINMGIMSREEAYQIINTPVYSVNDLQNDMDFVLKKLELTSLEFDKIMNLPIKSHLDYPSLYNRHYKWARMLGKKFGDDFYFEHH